MTARLTAFALALIGLVALRAQFDAHVVGTVADRLWVMAGFFTLWTNTVLTVHLLAITKGWRVSASRLAGLLLSIVMVGAVYHLVLAGLWNPQGIAWWTQQGLHTAMPLGFLAWWLAFAPKDVAVKDIPVWLLWPLSYCGFALIRGAATGFWPYPFLNADAIGWPRVALNCGVLLVIFAALGLAIVLIARRLQARPS